RQVSAAWAGWTALLPGGAGPAPVLAVELVCHLTVDGHPLSVPAVARALRAATAAGIPTVLTNAVRFREPGDAVAADLGDAVAALVDLESTTTLAPNAQAWLKPPALVEAVAAAAAAAAALGADGARRLLARTQDVADRCRLDPAADLGWGVARVPEADVLGVRGDAVGELRARCEAGIADRHPGARGAQLRRLHERLEAELRVIAELGYGPYFLAVDEVVRLVRRMGVRITARGSAAGSVVTWLLRISGVDPVANGLLFERFISLRRETLPDIDVDVESARRHDVYRELASRFGHERVALMSTTQAYRGRGAVRDAGLALGVDPGVVDEVAKSLRGVDARHLRRALAERPELRELAALVRADRQLDLLVDVSAFLDRLPRNASLHPCGVVLSDASLLDRTPVQPCGVAGLLASQFDKDDMDPMGWLKLDVLGVRMQSAMAHALAEIERTGPPAPGGGGVDLEAIALDDAATWELIRSTQTLGVFQVESPGQRELLGKFQPQTFEHLVVDVALFRPGPMANDMVTPFLEAHHGWRRHPLPHEDLRPILRDTHGVAVFHEQVMRILDVFTGCGLAQADVLRRRLGDPAGRAEVEGFFRDTATARGYTADVVERVWRVLEGHGGFGFARAHSAAFARTTYESAWLKAHHPAEFLAGLLEHDPGMYPRRLLLAEARRLGVPLLGVDVQVSREAWRVEVLPDGRRGIRAALSGVRGISAAEVARIVGQQPFADLTDLRVRARPHRPVLRRLAAVGGLDALAGVGRPHPVTARLVTGGDLLARLERTLAR
ncbi:DNA polymerase III subunit alpha, partial [Kineococcus glutinatus]|uniref:helix-hairpin-helix domain-containing protein n=1 Tax=Kineococcus glutinatus TaxID=1070872 RepID=UPI0031E4F6B9